VGAAAAASTLATDDAAAWASLLSRARADHDLTVRLAAGGDESLGNTAVGWSCLDCGKMNEIAVTKCAYCADGTHPSATDIPAAR
jgi:hypothetical protein